MNRYVVNITDDALEDMEQLYYYIAVKLQAKENAMGQYNRIADSILTLDTLPERYPLMDLEEKKQGKLRLMPVDNYSILYTIDDGIVTVTNVLYSASNIQARLKR